jgi:hypothetical protein
MSSIGRGNKITGKKKIKEDDKNSISQHFANIVTSPYKQDVSFLLVGQKGTGKSYASLSISHHTAEAIARKVDGGEGAASDFFNIDHIACVDPRMANEMITKCKKNGVYMYDDIGLGWNARKWQSDENVKKNDIFQINRIDQTVQIFSVPNQFLLDKIPRSLVSHYGETDRQFFSKGFVTIKLFKPQTLFRQGKLIQPYLTTDNSKYILYAIGKPPKDLFDAYDKLREEVTKRIIEERSQEDTDTKKETPIEKQRKIMYERIENFKKGYDETLSLKQNLRNMKIPDGTYRSWKSNGYV